MKILDCCEFFEMVESEHGVIERFEEFYVEDVTCGGGCGDFEGWAVESFGDALSTRWRFRHVEKEMGDVCNSERAVR